LLGKKGQRKRPWKGPLKNVNPEAYPDKLDSGSREFGVKIRYFFLGSMASDVKNNVSINWVKRMINARRPGISS
jgi:hypothetical protein